MGVLMGLEGEMGCRRVARRPPRLPPLRGCWRNVHAAALVGGLQGWTAPGCLEAAMANYVLPPRPLCHHRDNKPRR